MACRRCGQCCATVTFILGGVESDKDTDEFQKFVAFHRCDIYRVEQEGKPDVMGVKIPLVCKHLEFDGKTGLASCSIYEKRPKICQKHLCDYAKGNSPDESQT